MMALMVSESMARAGYKAPRPGYKAPRLESMVRLGRRPLWPFYPLRPLRPLAEELSSLQRTCDVFSDESSVFNVCEDIKGNVETFQINMEETAKSFMNEQTSILEDVVASVCKAIDDDFDAAGNDQVKNKHCNKMDSRRGGMFND